MNSTNLASLGMLIIFAGFLVVIVGAVLGAGGSTSSGGLILIGPIPIVFGSGPNSSMLASVGLAISAAMIAVYLVSFLTWRWKRRREAE
ncbi:MAG TPA: DUF131 domain-containing protein [Nitrososphaerales archaeon]|nr:DUF131 domain-containing protein [Nitrososphaerales archaeon]